MRIVTFVSILSIACISYADQHTADELENWIKSDQVITFDTTPGTILDVDDLEKLSTAVPPGYLQYLDFPEFQLEIQATGDYPPNNAYQTASEKFSGTAKIGEDGALQDYVAGLPFSTDRIDTADTREAGFMVAWNNIFRSQYYGYRTKPVTMFYLRTGADSNVGERPEGVGGSAKIERSVEMWFHRVYLNHLAMLPNQNYKLDVSGADENHYKDFMEILAPFDVAGAKFIIERSLDPYEEDQVNSYLPTERRVRRLSAQERADTFLGTDYTFDDFEGFSGRVMDYEWSLVGERAILSVADSKHDRVHVFGPTSFVPNDHWQLRDCYVVAMVPRWEKHPYGVKYIFFDKQTWAVQFAMIYNRDRVLWKTIDPVLKFPENDSDVDENTLTIGRWMATIGADLINETTTVSQSHHTDLPTMKKSSIKRLFDVSSLNEGR